MLKHKKQKRSKPNIHVEFQFSDQQRSILSNSLDFLMHCETFSFENEKKLVAISKELNIPYEKCEVSNSEKFGVIK